jgi:hypothetical protein
MVLADALFWARSRWAIVLFGCFAKQATKILRRDARGDRSSLAD